MLLPAARERLARIALVKPDKARGVEDLVLQAAQRGQIVERVRACRPFLLKVLLQSTLQGTALCPRQGVQERPVVLLLEQHGVEGFTCHIHRPSDLHATANSLLHWTRLCPWQVSEERLISLLEQINAQGGGRTQPRVTIQRRRPVWEDEDG